MIASLIKNDQVALIEYASDLMPAGQPKFEDIKFYPSITQIVEKFGKKQIRVILTALVKNFCDSVKVNEDKKMNETQMVECACFLLDECDNYRIEDYVIMFSLAKRGKLEIGQKGRVFDRVDIQLISDFKANYEALRQQSEDKIHQDQLLKTEKTRLPDPRDNPDEPDEVKKNRWNLVSEKLQEIVSKSKEDEAKEREETQKKKEDVWGKILDKAKQDGHEGSIINLSPFKPKT